MIATTLIPIPAAYALAHDDSPARKIVAGTVPRSALFYKVGLYGTLPVLIVVYVSINLSFAVWLLTIVLRNLPRLSTLCYVDFDGCIEHRRRARYVE